MNRLNFLKEHFVKFADEEIVKVPENISYNVEEEIKQLPQLINIYFTKKVLKRNNPEDMRIREFTNQIINMMISILANNSVNEELQTFLFECLIQIFDDIKEKANKKEYREYFKSKDLKSLWSIQTFQQIKDLYDRYTVESNFHLKVKLMNIFLTILDQKF